MSTKKTRIQFDLPQHRIDELNDIMMKCDLSTRRELFNNALTLFEWAVRQREMGLEVGSIDETNKEVNILHMPALANVMQVATEARSSKEYKLAAAH